MRRIVDDDPPSIRRFNRTVSRRTDRLVRRMLDKRPHRRPAAGDLPELLRETARAAREGQPDVPWGAIALGGGGLLAAAALGLWLLA